jgi:hypothetical protein
MAIYEIRIIKREANSTFAEDLARFDEKNPSRYFDPSMDRDNRRMQHPDYPQRERVTDALMTELSEDQYKKVKAEIIKAFE